MAVVFTVLMVMAGIYALFKWPIPTLAVLGVLIVIGKSGENKNGGTAPTTAPPPAKPKAPDSPIKPQAVQPTAQAQPKAPEVRKAYTAPSMKELLYPAEVPTFAELAEGKHKDPRALIYTIGNLDPERKRPFAEDDISYLDFGRKSSAYSALKKAGLIEPLTPSEEIEKALTKDELMALVRERGLPDTGKKRALADRLAGSGYKLNRRKTGGHLFRLTETGAGIVTVCRNDKRAAINRAIAALKERNYQGAVEAYRKYDSKWGFAHTSGKVHTIFAYYDIPCGRFQCIENCAMAELHIAKMRNDLGYFKTSPAVPTHFTGIDFKDGPSVWKAKVLKSSGMKTLPGAGGMSKGFLVKFSSGHVGMVQRRIGSKSSHTRTAKGYKRWTNAKGNVEKLVTMGSPSATAMHHTIWPEVEPSVEEYLQERLQAQVERVLARAGKK